MWFFKKKKEEKTSKIEKQEVKKETQPVKEEAKPEVKKTATKKETVKKVEENKTATKKNDTKSVYHVSKREEDGVWQVKYTGGRVIKLCKTKEEAMEYAKNMATNQNGTVIFHPSKGQNKGKFQKAK